MDIDLKKEFKAMVNALKDAGRMKFVNRQQRKYENAHVVTGKVKGKQSIPLRKQYGPEKEILVRTRIDWRQGKYTGEKLREIRKAQVDKIIGNQTHFDDGTPIIRNGVAYA